jgi:hypothetical protein
MRFLSMILLNQDSDLVPGEQFMADIDKLMAG